jgi:1,4-alpha-glucan branching enzyme
MIYKEPMLEGSQVRVTFELPSSLWAERVNLVGDFNDWDTTRDEMTQSRTNGNWRITLILPIGREYQFRYLVNGRDWHNEWHADKYVPNKYGSDNSVVTT